MNENKTIETVILRYLQKNISEEEMKELMSWIKENEEHKEMFFQMKNTYDLRVGGLFPTADEMEESKKRLFTKIAKAEETERVLQMEQKKKRRLQTLGKYAAVALVCIMATLGVQYIMNTKSPRLYTELDMESGPRMGHMTLPDGTKVILNASTKLRFPDKFEKDMREVYLDGEAYFDVIRNEKAPFIVHTDKQKIRVLGTQFNVMDYSVDDYSITTLVSGAIQMQAVGKTGEYGDPVILKPNQQVFFNKENNHLALSNIEINMSRTWVNKVYHFKSEPLLQITTRLEKLYGIQIHIQNEELKETEFTGTFGLDQELDEVLRIINFEKQFTYEKTEDEIFIK